MSDMYKFLAIVTEAGVVNFKPGETVLISKEYGGGVGQFVEFTPGRGVCVVNIKGEPQELPIESLETAVDPSTSYYDGNTGEQRYNEIEDGCHYLPDKPDLQPGQMVKIDNLYGAGNGAGYGVFVAYALDGKSAICNVDSEECSYPIEYISTADEKDQSDQFMDTDNDGSLSPISYGDDNRMKIKTGDSDERFRKMDERY